MELRPLRYFVVLAEELHFGNAARRLHITQPPLSFAIRQLEEALGTRLFVRDSRSVRLTPVGAAFLPEAIRVVAQAQAAEDTGRALAAGRLGKLHIGFTSSMLYRGMPEILKAFGAHRPGIDVHLADMTVAEQSDALTRRLIHGGFTTRANVVPELEGTALLPDTFVCCVPQGHWAAAKRKLGLLTLAQEDFVIFARDVTPSGYDHVLSMCQRAGFRPREKAHVRQWITAIALVSTGLGIALVPASLQAAGLRGVKFIPLEDAETQTSGYFIWNPAAMSPALESFIDEVSAFLARK